MCKVKKLGFPSFQEFPVSCASKYQASACALKGATLGFMSFTLLALPPLTVQRFHLIWSASLWLKHPTVESTLHPIGKKLCRYPHSKGINVSSPRGKPPLPTWVSSNLSQPFCWCRIWQWYSKNVYMVVMVVVNPGGPWWSLMWRGPTLGPAKLVAGTSFMFQSNLGSLEMLRDGGSKKKGMQGRITLPPLLLFFCILLACATTTPSSCHFLSFPNHSLNFFLTLKINQLAS